MSNWKRIFLFDDDANFALGNGDIDCRQSQFPREWFLVNVGFLPKGFLEVEVVDDDRFALALCAPAGGGGFPPSIPGLGVSWNVIWCLDVDSGPEMVDAAALGDADPSADVIELRDVVWSRPRLTFSSRMNLSPFWTL